MLRLATVSILFAVTGCLSPGGDVLPLTISAGEPTSTSGLTGPTTSTTDSTVNATTQTAGTSTSTDGTTGVSCDERPCSATDSLATGPSTAESTATSASDATSTTTEAAGTTEPPDTCGDFEVQPGEECDDGNLVQDDECSNTCQRPRLVFVTQDAWFGNLGGVAGADAKCATEASKNAMLAGRSFRAWISTNMSAPASTFDHDFLGIYRLVGDQDVVIAMDGWKTLSAGTLTSAINGDHTGALVVDVSPWTATTDSGGHQGEDCEAWTSSSSLANGGVGSLTKLAGWSLNQEQPCQTERRLYCFEQP